MASKTDFQENYPFMTCIVAGGIEYLGIVINCDHQVISIYDLQSIKNNQDQLKFLELGEIWWWESNRKISINIFLKKDMLAYRHAIKTFNIKDVKIIFGPVVNLGELSDRRIKRKSIQLVRKNKK
jgi:hypothetical protein